MYTLAILAAFSTALNVLPSMTWNDTNPNAQAYGVSLAQPCGYVLHESFVNREGVRADLYVAMVGNVETPFFTLAAARKSVESVCAVSTREDQ